VSALLAAHLALAAGYGGVQWTVRALVYPQFTAVPAAVWVAFHRGHSRRIARVVGPLFAGQLATTAALLVQRSAAVPAAALLVGAGCLAVVLGVTALGAVPQHRRLGDGWDGAAYRRLLRADTVRLAAAAGSVAAAVWAALA
jgi:hypothetical protein